MKARKSFLYALMVSLLIYTAVWAALKSSTVHPTGNYTSSDRVITVPSPERTLIPPTAVPSPHYKWWRSNLSNFSSDTEGEQGYLSGVNAAGNAVTIAYRGPKSFAHGLSNPSQMLFEWNGTLTITPTATNSPTNSPTNTPTPTPTPTFTMTFTFTPTPIFGCVSGLGTTPVTVSKPFLAGAAIIASYSSPCTQCLVPIFVTQLGVTAFSITASTGMVGVWNACYEVRGSNSFYMIVPQNNFFVLYQDAGRGQWEARKVYTDLKNLSDFERNNLIRSI